MRHYQKQIGASLGIQNQVAEIKLRAERKAGMLLKKDPDIQRGNQKGQRVTLDSKYGVTKKESSRWQDEAAVPVGEFEDFLKQRQESKEEITQSGLLSLARKEKQ